MRYPKIIVIAGCNGSEKSTYYTSKSISERDNNLFYQSKHINADEILVKNGGDWHKDSDNLRAIRQELLEIRECIQNKQSFDFETTFAANKKAIPIF